MEEGKARGSGGDDNGDREAHSAHDRCRAAVQAHRIGPRRRGGQGRERRTREEDGMATVWSRE